MHCEGQTQAPDLCAATALHFPYSSFLSLYFFVVSHLWLPAMGNHALVSAFNVLLGGTFLFGGYLLQRSEC